MTSLLSTKSNVTIVIGLALLLSACAAQPVSTPTSVAFQPTATSTLPLPASPTPTATLQPIAPSATPTVPLPTPTATAIPTLVAPIPTPHGDGPCTYQAAFLGDVTFPDNTIVSPGMAFVKTWRVRNDGTCMWGTTGYALHSLVFYHGDRLSAPTTISLPGEVPPGNIIDLSVSMIAPTQPGTYHSEWMLSIDGGSLIGVGASNIPLYAQIVVNGSSNVGPGDGMCVYRAQFLGDVTIPDNTNIAAGSSFVKTWRVRNDGTCSWGSNGYALRSLVFYNGDHLGMFNSIALPGEVPPGSVVDLSVNMIAPQNPGVYRSEWMLSIVGDPYGPRLLGVGAAGSRPLYAQIVVPSSGGSGQSQTYRSNTYHYALSYPAGWTIQVNTSVPTGGGSNPEYVTLMPPTGGLPRMEIEALTGVPPMTGFENCVPNFVFHNVPACKIFLPAGQNPAEDVWVFQKGTAYFYIQLQYQDAGSTQVFDDIMTSFNFTG